MIIIIPLIKSSVFLLTHIGHPDLLVPPENTIVRIGSLSCSFLANPNDGIIQWQCRNGKM